MVWISGHAQFSEPTLQENKQKKNPKKLYLSVDDIVNFVPLRKGTLIFVKLCPAGAFLHFSNNSKKFSLPAHQGLMC